MESQFNNAIQKYLSRINFDLILYSTPPITFTKVVKRLKAKNTKAISYLLLKDIFPQNAVDLGFFSTRSLFYKYFRKKEIDLYLNSDYIGCMSPANVDFVLKHNGFISNDRVEIAPNYPSRLMSYLEYKMPIIAATDVNTDIGTIAMQNEYGYCCESRNVDDFTRCIDRYIDNPSSIRIMGEKGYQFLKENYLVDNTYNTIMSHL